MHFLKLKSLFLIATVILFVGCNGDSKDLSAPVITLLGDNPMSIEVGSEFADPGATVTDDIDGELTATVSGSVDASLLGSYTLNYEATDAAGNSASATRTVDVVDSTAPVITLLGDNPMTIDQGSDFTDPGATVADNYDTSLTVTVGGSVDTATAGSYTLNYDAVDASGNVAATVERTVNVVYSGQLAVVPAGSDLVLLGLNAVGELEERGRASLSSELAGYNTNHVIFGIAKHPTNNTVFVTSMNECGAAELPTDGCWGNARIDRFSYDATSITYDGLAFLAQGPLRLSAPAFDETSSTLSMTLSNQSAEDISIDTVGLDEYPTDSAFTTACNGATLAAGDGCALEITAVDQSLDAYITITTTTTVFTTALFYDDGREAYIANGLYDEGDDPTTEMPDCVNDDWGESNQYGACALTALAISADGSRVFVNEDDYDVALVFSLDGSGSLTFLSQSEDNLDHQGIAVNEDATALYNGSNAYSIVDDVVTLASDDNVWNNGGNATEVVTAADGQHLLISTIQNQVLEIYELDTDPLLPTLLSSIDPSLGKARFQDHSADLTLFTVIDLNDMATVSFDGTTLTELSSMDISIDLGTCEDCDYDAYTRGVQMTADGAFAVTSAFVNAYDQETLDAAAFLGAATCYSIDASTGAMTQISRLELDGMARAILFVDTP